MLKKKKEGLQSLIMLMKDTEGEIVTLKEQTIQEAIRRIGDYFSIAPEHSYRDIKHYLRVDDRVVNEALRRMHEARILHRYSDDEEQTYYVRLEGLRRKLHATVYDMYRGLEKIVVSKEQEKIVTVVPEVVLGMGGTYGRYYCSAFLTWRRTMAHSWDIEEYRDWEFVSASRTTADRTVTLKINVENRERDLVKLIGIFRKQPGKEWKIPEEAFGSYVRAAFLGKTRIRKDGSEEFQIGIASKIAFKSMFLDRGARMIADEADRKTKRAYDLLDQLWGFYEEMPTNPTLLKLINYFFKHETPVEKINSKSDAISTAAISEHWDHMEYLQKRLEDLLFVRKL